MFMGHRVWDVPASETRPLLPPPVGPAGWGGVESEREGGGGREGGEGEREREKE